ncbi:IclR family transcriptional regulator [Ureibacillus aquaedulcis]|uniref:IclR family transcriptional regulator n=1 Tax=Ureibacillus aquaedulcis TaxID=3058421 RepID=A0ABT8GML6_9BACL|nr:IclR family transcriptional regulator [Ureibacillus sp. BA0131]MDN4492494.1 IclR family transcriptional regulator [Ureibacillus sp. BA0131]
MQTIDRAMDIIKALANNSKWLSITELSKECKLPVSTMHRLLKSLEKHGLILQNEKTKEYGLGTLWLEYGLQMYDSIDFTSHIRAEMEKLMHIVKETIYFNKPMGETESLIFERIDSSENQIRVVDKIGVRVPMNIGAANKTMLAHMDKAKSNQIINILVPESEKLIFLEHINEIKANGYGISRGERTEGTISIAAPVFNHSGDIEGAISIGCVSFNMTNEKLQFLIENVMESGRRISKNLAYKG